MATSLKISRVQKKGQVTIPAEIRYKLGLEEGDLVAFVETEYGEVIRPQALVPAEMLEHSKDEAGRAFILSRTLPA